MTTRTAPGSSARTPATMWEVLVWAYKRECVHAVTTPRRQMRGPRPPSVTATFTTLSALQLGAIIPTTGHGESGDRFHVHDDAVAVHEVVRALPGAGHVIRAAASGVLPAWRRDVSDVRCVPAIDPHAAVVKPYIMYADARSRRPLYCVIRYVGYTTAEREAMAAALRAEYLAFADAVAAVLNASDWAHLTRWRPASPGVPTQPWAKVIGVNHEARLTRAKT